MKFGHNVVVAVAAIAGVVEGKLGGPNVEKKREGIVRELGTHHNQQQQHRSPPQPEGWTHHGSKNHNHSTNTLSCSGSEHVNSGGCEWTSVSGSCVLTVTDCTGKFTFTSVTGDGIIKIPDTVHSLKGDSVSSGGCIEMSNYISNLDIGNNAGLIQAGGGTCSGEEGTMSAMTNHQNDEDVKIQIQIQTNEFTPQLYPSSEEGTMSVMSNHHNNEDVKIQIKTNLRGGGEGELNPSNYDPHNIIGNYDPHIANDGVCVGGQHVNSNGCSFTTINGGCVLTVTDCSGEFHFVTLNGGGVIKVPADVTSVSGVTMNGGSCIEAESSSTTFDIVTENAGATIQKDGATCGYSGAGNWTVYFEKNGDVEIQIQTNDGDNV